MTFQSDSAFAANSATEATQMAGKTGPDKPSQRYFCKLKNCDSSCTTEIAVDNLRQYCSKTN